MAVLVFGSLNIDHVYQVEHFVRPGETLASAAYQQFPGGKGANQSVALARAGAEVFHAGRIGPEGVWLREELARNGVDTTHVLVGDVPTGHAIIQVDPRGENAIVLYGGANQAVTETDAARVLEQFGPGDWLLLQNEISALPEILRIANGRGIAVAFNPAPMTPAVQEYPLDGVELLIVNETEGAALADAQEPQAILQNLRRRFPQAALLLTLGGAGSLYVPDSPADAAPIEMPAQPVEAVDTTAAGDTFIGYFLAARMANRPPEEALGWATKAAALCVTREGAAASIPRQEEVGQ